MKLNILFSIIVLSFLLTSCASNEVAKDSGVVGSDSIIESESETITSTEADLRIVDGKIDPRDTTIKVDEQVTLTIHNQQDTMVRIDIPMYGSDVSVDIPADGYEIVTLNPSYTGFVAIELNGNQLGTIIVE